MAGSKGLCSVLCALRLENCSGDDGLKEDGYGDEIFVAHGYPVYAFFTGLSSGRWSGWVDFRNYPIPGRAEGRRKH